MKWIAGVYRFCIVHLAVQAPESISLDYRQPPCSLRPSVRQPCCCMLKPWATQQLSGSLATLKKSSSSSLWAT